MLQSCGDVAGFGLALRAVMVGGRRGERRKDERREDERIVRLREVA